jgi:hypothetical protein
MQPLGAAHKDVAVAVALDIIASIPVTYDKSKRKSSRIKNAIGSEELSSHPPLVFRLSFINSAVSVYPSLVLITVSSHRSSVQVLALAASIVFIRETVWHMLGRKPKSPIKTSRS